MKKKIYLFLLAMLACAVSFAQHPGVQGIPRPLAKRSVQAEPAVVMPNIDFGKIQYWVGDGTKEAALVIKWDDGKGGNKNLVWGYKWTDAADGTGEAMLRAVAKADPRFYMLVYGNTQYGAAIGGMGYDLNGNGNISLVKGGTSYSLTAGVYNTTAYDFDSWSSNDTADHWCAGWYNGYWSYWVTDDTDTAFEYSGLGASSRKLTDGSIDGWSYMYDMENWYSNDMTGEVEYVLPPVVNSRRNIAEEEGEVREPKTFTQVNTLARLREIIDNEAIDGDTIIFAPGMRGVELENDIPSDYRITKSVTIIGNGVIIGPGNGFHQYLRSGDLTFKDFVFRGITESAIHTYECNLTVENCIFEDITSEYDGPAIRYENLNGGVEYDVNIKKCRFSGNKTTKTSKSGTVYIKDSPLGEGTSWINAKIVSCTFEGNEAGKGSGIYFTNYPKACFTNCVFENNTNTKAAGCTIHLSSGDDVKADVIRSLGYNVIEGNINGTEVNRLTETDLIGEDLDPILSYQEGEYQVIKDGPAYNRMPANTVIEGITLPETDITGLKIDYTKPSHSGACQLVYEEGKTTDYTKGTFIVNEDWYGHQNSTVNFLTDDGEWIYRVVQKENPGVELGCTNQYGTIYGDKFYLIAKQAKDPGASITGGRITVCDAKTMKVLKQIENISTDESGTSNADGRGFLGVDEHKGYIGSSNGIYVFDLDNLEVTGSVTGTGNGADDAYGALYSGQIGNMVRVNDRVFAVHQKNGLLVIDANTDKVEQTIEGPDGWGFGSVVLSKDGNLWLSLANPSGSGQADVRLLKVDPVTLEQTIIECPDGIYGPANSWYAWTPDCFSASKQQNVLYWNGGRGSWFSGSTVYKYDIDKNEFSTYLDFNDDPDGWQIYGCSFRVSPVTDEAYVSLYKSFGDPTYVLRKYDSTGNMLAEYPMITNYWFPSLPVFPDNEAPVVSGIDPVELSDGNITTVSLKDIATDADNMDAAIVKTVKNISNESVVKAEMQHGDLVITPLANGNADITVQVNSNGKLAETVVSVTVVGTTGIDGVMSEEAKETGRYTLDGKQLDGKQRGINIVRMSDGTIKKVIVK